MDQKPNQTKLKWRPKQSTNLLWKLLKNQVMILCKKELILI